jgi:hypothetical protein
MTFSYLVMRLAALPLSLDMSNLLENGDGDDSFTLCGFALVVPDRYARPHGSFLRVSESQDSHAGRLRSPRLAKKRSAWLLGLWSLLISCYETRRCPEPDLTEAGKSLG